MRVPSPLKLAHVEAADGEGRGLLRSWWKSLCLKTKKKEKKANKEAAGWICPKQAVTAVGARSQALQSIPLSRAQPLGNTRGHRSNPGTGWRTGRATQDPDLPLTQPGCLLPDWNFYWHGPGEVWLTAPNAAQVDAAWPAPRAGAASTQKRRKRNRKEELSGNKSIPS